jgi:hypothetical protein
MLYQVMLLIQGIFFMGTQNRTEIFLNLNLRKPLNTFIFIDKQQLHL